MANRMKLKIISQTRKIYEGLVDYVTVPGELGQMGILPGHANIISLLDVGEVKITVDGKNTFIAINGGIIEVKKNNIIILANEAALPEEIIEKEIDNAIKMAEKKLASKLEPSELIQLERHIRYEKLKRKLKDKLG
jgi:F-type H+-transporting ATPase subunit epsilon